MDRPPDSIFDVVIDDATVDALAKGQRIASGDSAVYPPARQTSGKNAALRDAMAKEIARRFSGGTLELLSIQDESICTMDLGTIVVADGIVHMGAGTAAAERSGDIASAIIESPCGRYAMTLSVGPSPRYDITMNRSMVYGGESVTITEITIAA